MTKVVLRLPKIYTFTGIIGGILFFSFFINSLINFNNTIALITMMFLTLSLILILGGQIYRVNLFDSYIIQITWYGKTKRIIWDNVSKVSYGKISKELKISDGITKIKAHSDMVNFEALIIMLEKKAGIKKNDIEGYEEARL